MAEGVGDHRGGILGLRADVLAYSRRREAFHYDLLTKLGKSLDDLGTLDFPWTDAIVFARVVQQDHNSMLGRELHGPTWSVEAQLMAEATDALNMANWQRGGRRSAPKPKPIPRPWLKPKSTSLGADPIPISQFNDWWDKPRKKS